MDKKLAQILETAGLLSIAVALITLIFVVLGLVR